MLNPKIEALVNALRDAYESTTWNLNIKRIEDLEKVARIRGDIIKNVVRKLGVPWTYPDETPTGTMLIQTSFGPLNQRTDRFSIAERKHSVKVLDWSQTVFRGACGCEFYFDTHTSVVTAKQCSDHKSWPADIRAYHDAYKGTGWPWQSVTGKGPVTWQDNVSPESCARRCPWVFADLFFDKDQRIVAEFELTSSELEEALQRAGLE